MTPYPLLQDDLDGMVAHARREWPREACGLLMKHPAGGRVIYPAENVIGLLHRESPALWRPATEGFVLDPRTVAAAFFWLAQGFVVNALYHSHPSGQREFSAHDHQMARAASEDARMRATTWLVIGLPGRAAATTLSAWARNGRGMVERKVALG